MGQLDGKVVVLSGGASDIGRATALRLASEGAAVAVGDVSLDGAASVAEEVTAAGGQALGLVCDVRREESVADLVRAAAETFGGVDCVDHNAAWSHPRLDSDATGVEIGVWDRTIEITTRGALLLARQAIPFMAERGGGSIVTISSGTSTIGESVRVAYGVSKAALNQLTRHLAVRYGREGIRANAIAPGLHPHGDGGGQRPRRRAAAPGRRQPHAPPGHARRHRTRRGLLVQRRVELPQRAGAPRRRRPPDRRDDVGAACLTNTGWHWSRGPAGASGAAPRWRWPAAASTS